MLETDVKNGLTQEETKARQKKFGKNSLPKQKPLHWLEIFLSQFKSPLIYILLLAGVVTLLFRDFTNTAVIFAAVFLNAAFGFLQENKASKSLKELKKIVKQRIKIKRDGNWGIADSEDAVPGDIISLNPGDIVPADARIIESNDLQGNEMALTGESLPAGKISQILEKETSLADRDNMVYMGTIVEEGRGRALVVETGKDTEMGKISSMIREIKEEKTPYQKKLAHFSKIVAIIIGIISFIIFIEGLITGGDFLEIFTMAVAVAVASIPEGLPVAMTVILALGMQRILKKKGLVRKMISAETMGSVSVIAVDKTATLTEGKMKVAEIIGDKILSLKAAVSISEPLTRPTDKAFLEAGLEAGIGLPVNKTAELPFSAKNKFSAALVKENEEQVLYVCGAPEVILEKSVLNSLEKNNWQEKLEELSQRGLRVVASALKKNASDFQVQNLTFLGFIALSDPIRSGVREAMQICQQAGIKPIIITGDHKLTSKAVAKEIGLDIKDENILEGGDLEKLSESDFAKILPQVQIYARTEPSQKMRIIEAWQKRGEVVAMTGDGINDAPALKKANIGVALGSGTEVAKETSDLVLLNDSFSIIVAAIQEGRAILDNIRKVIVYSLSGSFSEVILVGVSILFGFPLPVLASQILWVNLIEDGPLGISLAFEPKEKGGGLMKHPPPKRDTPLLTRQMKTLIFIIGFITNIFLLGLFFWLTKYSGYEISHTRSIIFAGLAVDSIFYVFSCKSLSKNLWQINPFSNKFLILSWIFGVLMLLAALYTPFLQVFLKTVPLNFFDWQLILGLGIMNIILIEAVKWYFINKQRR